MPEPEASPVDDAPASVACIACPEPITLAEPHVTLNRFLEHRVGNDAYVHHAVTLAHLHAACAERVDAGELVTPAPATAALAELADKLEEDFALADDSYDTPLHRVVAAHATKLREMAATDA